VTYEVLYGTQVLQDPAALRKVQECVDAGEQARVFPITRGTEASDVAGAPSVETKRWLTYLSAGLTDESIAREFGVSERTIARRISRLQETLGAQTRFQLGVQASRQNWL
jgi:DNA-binding NarL/FixJ family response regulator